MELLDTPSRSKSQTVIDIIDNELGVVYFYENIVVMEAKEHVTLSIKNGLFTLLKILSVVGTKPTVYISHRVNRYSVDPNDYKYLNLIPHLKAIAVVSHDEYGRQSAQLEKRFFKKPFRTFGTLDQAKAWANEVIDGKTYPTTELQHHI